MQRLFFDLDGVFADFDAHFPALFGVDHRTLDDDTMWAHIHGHAGYFRSMPPCPGAVTFFQQTAIFDPIILTACPWKDYASTAIQKRAWVREHLSTETLVLPVNGGRWKPLFMHAPGDILVDDYEKNIVAWEKAGGIGILHRTFPETARALCQTELLRGCVL